MQESIADLPFKEKVCSLIRRQRELQAKLYTSDGILDSDKYKEKQGVEEEIDSITSPRVYKIIEIIQSIPNGMWNNPSPYRISNTTFQAVRDYTRSNCKRIKYQILAKGRDEHGTSVEFLGYEYCYGEDDGYPTTSHIYIPLEWISEADDVALKRKILFEVAKDCRNKIEKLKDSLENEKHVLELVNEQINMIGERKIWLY